MHRIALVVLVMAAVEARAVVLPAGFAEDVVASGFDKPADAVSLPDGRLLVAEKAGVLWLVKGGVRTQLLDLRGEINATSDRGLTGLAVHPSFAQNGWVYLLYVVDPVAGEPDESAQRATWGRVTRYALSGDLLVASSRRVILGATAADGLPDCFTSHTVGTIAFGLDGTLFVGAGDGAHWDMADGGENVTSLDVTCEQTFGAAQDVGAWRAQELDSLAGKVLRVDAETGLGLPSNPFWDGSGASRRSRVFVRGLRNPFRFAVRPGTSGPGTLLIGDVGWARYEEIDVGRGGENFGWPCFEANDARSEFFDHPTIGPRCRALGTAGLTAPLVSLSHATDKAATGAFFYAGTRWPAKYRGAFFHADYVRNFINAYVLDGSNRLVSRETFATDVQSPVSLAPSPDGDLLYASILTGDIRRIRYATANEPPTVVLRATPTTGTPPLRVSFSSDGTSDREGDAFTLDWDFGDGTAHSSAANPVHDYTRGGTFTARLTATDARGASASRTVTITTENAAPRLTLTSPVDGLRFTDGQVIALTATASDAEDGTALAWRWVIDLIHAEHVHPQEYVSSSPTPPPYTLYVHGETGERFSYRLTVTVVDSQGASASAVANLLPAGMPNAAPAASFTATPSTGASPLVVTFDAAATRDPDGDLVTYAWDYGDGARGTGSRGTHIYDRTGTFTATLTASDPFGASGTSQRVITVAPDTAPPVARWPLDEGTGFVAGDASGGGANGTVMEAAWVAGRSGSALSFDGVNDAVRIASRASVSLAGDATIAAWIRVADPARDSYMRIVSKKSAWSATGGYSLSYHPQKNLLELHGSGADQARGTVDLDTRWHHVAAVVSGAVATLYVDGAVVSTDTTVTPLVANAADLYFGREAGGGNYFAGGLDEVRLYARALPAAEVAQLAQATVANRPPVANAQSLVTPENTPLAITLTGSDPDGDPLTFGIASPPARGTLTGTPPRVVYTPATGYAGPDAFTFEVRDGRGGVASASISISVQRASAGPAGWWKLDDGAGTSALDSSGNGATGTLLAGPVWTTGRMGGALSFDGVDDRVVTSAAPRLAASGAVTVAAWIRNADPLRAAYQRIASKKSAWDSPTGYALSFHPAKGLLEILGSGTDSGRATGVVLDGAWHHVAGVIDGTRARLYVDGVERTTDGVASAVVAGTTPLTLGSESGGSGRWKGALDDVRVYDRALTASEITALAAGAP